MYGPLTFVVLSEIGNELGEGPFWNVGDNSLYWVDIKNHQIHLLNIDVGKVKSIDISAAVSAVFPFSGNDIYAITEDGMILLNTKSGKKQLVCHPEKDRLSMRYNDATCDRQGRLWVGSLAKTKDGQKGKLWCCNTVGICIEKESDIEVANGIDWSLDYTKLYFVDSGKGVVYEYNFDEDTAAISERKVLINIDRSEGCPDGLTVDANGDIWVCIWDGACVRKYDQFGELILQIPLPVSRPTSCTFGGADMKTLFITTARTGLSAQQLITEPLAGKVLALETKSAGRIANKPQLNLAI